MLQRTELVKCTNYKHNLSEWLSTNKLILNLKKTEFMGFGTHQRLCRQDIDGAHIMLGGESVKHFDAFRVPRCSFGEQSFL